MKYLDILIAASGVNKENEIFHLTFGIVVVNWDWFLKNLTEIVNPNK